MNRRRLGWYWRRLRAMPPAEVAWRVCDATRRVWWARRQVRPGRTPGPASAVAAVGERRFGARLPPGSAGRVPAPAWEALEVEARALQEGRGVVLGVARADLAEPDWFLDPASGRRAPQDRYCFLIDHRRDDLTGNVKQVWELSRHHHLTVLAAAYHLTGDESFADLVDRQLRDWWRCNPNLSGIHWTSGIELGLRLIAWVWIRRFLDGWAGAPGLFERNPDAVRQIGWHQAYLAAFASRGSSANNHAVAEAAGQLVAACAFPWYDRSPRWRRSAARRLERHLERNTFPSGLNRELASEYHGFVTELGLLAATEAALAGHPLTPATRRRLAAMADAAASVVDERLRPPRQGDGDGGRVLVCDGSGGDGWGPLLAMAAALVGDRPWWPRVTADVRSTLVEALAGGALGPVERSGGRRSHFPDAGMTLLRSAGRGPEVWCRCDGGPHGLPGIAAHAHADALSVEVRHGGVEVLADPGTYCYHGEPAWRSYFRSTGAHNTLELAGTDQSRPGGPFLWTTAARSRVTRAGPDPAGPTEWEAEHDGYTGLDPPAVHRRRVALGDGGRRLRITDVVVCAGTHSCRLSFHLGPTVEVSLDGDVATLCWETGRAEVRLPAGLSWSVHKGLTRPPLGWYSPSFGVRVPAPALVGTGEVGPGRGGKGEPLVTEVVFSP